jgi:hypothetical protein
LLNCALRKHPLHRHIDGALHDTHAVTRQLAVHLQFSLLKVERIFHTQQN